MNRTLEIIVVIPQSDGTNREFKLSTDISTSIQIVKQISDIRDFSKRTNPYTQSFNIPADANNNLIFKNYNNLNTFNGYNTGKKVSVKILESGKVFFDGYLQMNSVITNGGKSQYQITCYNNLGNVIDNVAGVKDLDLSEYDHIFNYDNVVGSWDTYIIRNGDRYPYKNGMGYKYQYNDYLSFSGNISNRISDNSVKTEFFKPHIYAKTIWDKIYSSLGLSYRSDFLNSPNFESLVVTPDFNGLKTDNDLLEFNVGRVPDVTVSTINDWMFSNQTLHTGGPITTSKFIVPFNQDTHILTYDFNDPGNHFNTTNFQYTVPNKTVQDINVKVFVKATISAYQDEYGTVIPECQYPYKTIHDGDITYYVYLNLNRNNVTTTIDSNSINIPVSVQGPTNCFDISTQEVPVSVAGYQFLAGDKISVRVGARYNIRSWISQDRYDPLAGYQRDFEVKTRAKLKVLTGSQFNNRVLNEFIQAGDPVNINSLLPDMTQSDFIRSISKMFNLYIYPDPNDQNVHIIEPYDQFFGQDGNISDWTHKYNKKDDLIKEPLNEISSKNILLTYNTDTDYLNDKYTDKYAETFGQYLIEFDNDFKTGTTEERIKFAPTPLVNEINTDKIISKLYKLSNNVETGYVGNNKPRILYSNLLSCSTYTIIDDVDGTFSHTNYAYSGFLDNPFDPTIDINFFVTKEYYHTYDLIPLNNLYNLYWSNYFNNVNSHPDLITGLFDLTSKDIYEFNFRDLILLDGNYYIVNKIEYSITNAALSKVELIKSNFNDLNGKSINRDVAQFSTMQDGSLNGFVDGNRERKSLIWPITRNNSMEFDYVRVNNQIVGYKNILSTRSNANSVMGDNNMLSGQHNDVKGSNNELNNLSNVILSGDDNLIDNSFKNSLWIGSGSSASEQGSKNIIVGDNNTLNHIDQSIIIGDDLNIQDYQYSSLILGSGMTISGTSSFNIIFGTACPQYIPLNDLKDIMDSNNFNKVNAGRDEIVSRWSKIRINIINAGTDEILQHGSFINQNFITAGRDEI